MVSRVFTLTCELGIALGWDNISLEPGCQEHAIDDHWWFAINPHNEPTPCSRGAIAAPQSIYFEFNGSPAGFVSHDGGLLAAGAIANEEALARALMQAIAAKGGAPCHLKPL